MRAHFLAATGLAALACIWSNRDQHAIATGSPIPATITDTLNLRNMKMNAGIITARLGETREFYTSKLGFEVAYETDWFLLLTSPGGQQISFLQPSHPSQQPLFHKPFTGQGVYLTIEVEDVDQLYARLREKRLEISIEMRDEPWGDRHFAIVDPNGIGLDFVKYTPPNEG